MRQQFTVILVCLGLVSGEVANAAELVIEEVVVTATKREQSLQDLALSGIAISGEDIKNSGSVRMEDVTVTQPGVFVSESFTGNQIYIRGIGTGLANASFEQSVATFVDGVYTGRGMQSRGPLLDIERLEIVKGPQPTYFGQNAIAGAMNIITRQPSAEWQGFVDANGGSFGEVGGEVAIGGPLSDAFGVRAAFNYSEMDGWGEDTFADDDAPSRETWSGRVTFLFAPTDSFEAVLKFEMSDFEESDFVLEQIFCADDAVLSAGPPLGLPAPCRQARDLGLDVEYQPNGKQAAGGTIAWPGGNDWTGYPELFDNNDRLFENDNATLTLNWEVADYTLTSITSRGEYESSSWFDLDSTPIAGFNVLASEDYEQFSQELRITSPTEGRVEWLAGVYFQNGELDYGAEQYIGLPFFPPGIGATGGIDFEEEADWVSVFAQANINLSDSWKLDIGVRWSDVEKDGSNYAIVAGGNPTVPTLTQAGGLAGPFAQRNPTGCAANNTADGGTCARAKYEDDDVSGTVGLMYFWDDNMAYAKVSTGFKAGGLNTGMSVAPTVDEFVYDAEEVDGLEVGVKSRLWDGRVQLNVAAFKSEYEKLQVSAFDPTAGISGQFTVGNAAEATSQGLEIDGMIAVSENFMLAFGAMLLDAEYDSFPGAQCNFLEISAGACGTTGTTDRKGKPLEFSADWEANIRGDYTVPLSNGLELAVVGEIFFSDGYIASNVFDERIVQDSYERLNLRIELGPADRRWLLALYGRNLTDEEVITQLGPTVLNGVTAASVASTRGSSFGAQLRYNFW